MADRQAVLSQFVGFTGCQDRAVALRCLEAANWDLEEAAGLYFDSASAGPVPSNPQVHAQPQARPAPVAAPVASKPKNNSSGGGIKSLSDLAKEADEEREAYFAGGSEKSGVQIQDPRKKPQSADIVSQVFENAKKMGAQNVDDMQVDKPKFAGSGFRLGDQGHPSAAVPPPTQPGQPKITKLITFYKQGFTVNDGPLRRFDDKENQAFLEDINQGYVPRELEAEAQGAEVHVELADKKQEDYKEPAKPKYLAFHGEGYSLSSSGGAKPAAPVPAAAPKREVVVDNNKPTTTIQIRLADGSRLVGKFNHDHTVMDIRSFIESSKPQSGVYDLIGSFPPKPLTDSNQTVKDAGLLNAAINQKMR